MKDEVILSTIQPPVSIQTAISRDGRLTLAFAQSANQIAVGAARVHPNDKPYRQIGLDLAIGRALTSLGHCFRNRAVEMVEELDYEKRLSDVSITMQFVPTVAETSEQTGRRGIFYRFLRKG